MNEEKFVCSVDLHLCDGICEKEHGAACSMKIRQRYRMGPTTILYDGHGSATTQSRTFTRQEEED